MAQRDAVKRMDGRIRKLCDGAYLICGKAICFDSPDMFDMDDPGIQADFIAFADDLYTEASDIGTRRYGSDTVCVFWYVEGGKHVTCGACCVDDLKDDLRMAIRKEMQWT